ncbi:DUF4383 domain-containing protein [Patescibacteria group bacterium]|nr:DUF4383 domain-containing protein [Patescibacteria group bacterium]
MAKKYVLVLGIIFVLIGILGFIDPLTPNGNLLGVFAVDLDHNLVHLLSGLVALAAVAGGESYSLLYAKVFGVVYAVVTILGFMVGDGQILGVIIVNQADNVLHLAIAASALYVGFAGDSKPKRAVA